MKTKQTKIKCATCGDTGVIQVRIHYSPFAGEIREIPCPTCQK